jgi:hypothetical protein
VFLCIHLVRASWTALNRALTSQLESFLCIPIAHVSEASYTSRCLYLRALKASYTSSSLIESFLCITHRSRLMSQMHSKMGGKMQVARHQRRRPRQQQQQQHTREANTSRRRECLVLVSQLFACTPLTRPLHAPYTPLTHASDTRRECLVLVATRRALGRGLGMSFRWRLR